MLQRLLLLFLVLIGLGILVFRLSSSGEEIARRTSFFSNPFTVIFEQTTDDPVPPVGGSPFPYPDSPDVPIDEILAGDSVNDAGSAAENELLAIEGEYDTLRARALDAREFGNPSPYRELIYIDESYGGVSADRAALEYVSLRAAEDNSAPISLTGWSLQSVVTKARVYIPRGARTLSGTSIPETVDIYLDPGNRGYVASGASPIGISFRENLCTGYLGQFQMFVPSLEERCPEAEGEVRSEPATARTSDPYCASFAATIPQCRFYVGEPPDSVTAQCYSFIRNSLTFAGCTARHSWRPSFAGDTWRIFLNQRRELWGNDHDSIRLLDAAGRTVDVWTY